MVRLSKGERIVAISSALLVTFSFFPLWATYSFEGFGQNESEGAKAWDPDAFAIWPKIAILLALVALVLVGLRAAGVNLTVPTDFGTVYMVLGGLAFLLLLFTLILGPRGLSEIAGLADIDVPGFEFNFEVSRGILLYGSPVLAGGIAFGGYLSKQGGAVTANSDPIVTPPPPEV